MNHLLTYTIGDDGIATIIIDQKNNPTNLFSFEFVRAYIEMAEKLVQDDSVKGVIVTSGQRMFMAGADLRELGGGGFDSKEFFESILKMHQSYRAIETAGKPFVAAINGTALGGGFELCLTCHHRIGLNSPKIKMGFPEVNVGLLPGGGGTVKVPYLLGIQNGLTYLLQGVQARPDKALKDGLIDAVADTPEEMMAAAKNGFWKTPTLCSLGTTKNTASPGAD